LVQYEKLPKIETNSFYQRCKPKTIRLELDTVSEKREFMETYVEYVYDDDGNCTMITRAYEDVDYARL